MEKSDEDKKTQEEDFDDSFELEDGDGEQESMEFLRKMGDKIDDFDEGDFDFTEEVEE